MKFSSWFSSFYYVLSIMFTMYIILWQFFFSLFSHVQSLLKSKYMLLLLYPIFSSQQRGWKRFVPCCLLLIMFKICLFQCLKLNLTTLAIRACDSQKLLNWCTCNFHLPRTMCHPSPKNLPNDSQQTIYFFWYLVIMVAQLAIFVVSFLV